MYTTPDAGGLPLLPTWLGVVWTAVFAGIAVSHLRHMAQTTGQRRPWHACHVLMAVGMAFMYLPASLDPFHLPVGFWKLAFAAAGLIAAVWSIGGVGRTVTVVWLLTAIDLGAMLYMWSGSERAGNAPVTWMLAAYLTAEAVAWAFDLYQRIDGGSPLVSWRALAAQPGGGRVGVTATAARTESLLGTLDISASMVAMTVGMAYMLVAMQLAT